jgi:hypothetical protein
VLRGSPFLNKLCQASRSK